MIVIDDNHLAPQRVFFNSGDFTARHGAYLIAGFTGKIDAVVGAEIGHGFGIDSLAVAELLDQLIAHRQHHQLRGHRGVCLLIGIGRRSRAGRRGRGGGHAGIRHVRFGFIDGFVARRGGHGRILMRLVQPTESTCESSRGNASYRDNAHGEGKIKAFAGQFFPEWGLFRFG